MQKYLIKKRTSNFDKDTIDKEIEFIARNIMSKSKTPVACVHTDYCIDPMNCEVRYVVKVETLDDLMEKYDKEVKQNV